MHYKHKIKDGSAKFIHDLINTGAGVCIQIESGEYVRVVSITLENNNYWNPKDSNTWFKFRFNLAGGNLPVKSLYDYRFKYYIEE